MRRSDSHRRLPSELALVVEDVWERIGLGAILLAQILQAGEQRGIDDFRADVLTTNAAMLCLLGRHTEVTRVTLKWTNRRRW